MLASPSHSLAPSRESGCTRAKRDVLDGDSMPPKKLRATRMPMSVFGENSRRDVQEARRSLVSRVLTRASDSGSSKMTDFPNESAVSAKRLLYSLHSDALEMRDRRRSHSFGLWV